MKTQSDLLLRLARKQANPGAIADRVLQQPRLLTPILDGLGADEARVKYGCAKVLLLISEKKPAVLYPQIDFFIALLDSSQTILKWNAILILGNLAAVDTRHKLEAILKHYLEPIRGPVMITAANTVRGAGRIAAAKPALADRIAREIMNVERAEYQTAECRNVALGHALVALDGFFDRITGQPMVIRFARRQLGNSRNATRNKAAAFLKKHAPAAVS